MTAREYIDAVTREENRGENHRQLSLAVCPPLRVEYDQATSTQFECIKSAYYRGFGTRK